MTLFSTQHLFVEITFGISYFTSRYLVFSNHNLLILSPIGIQSYIFLKDCLGSPVQCFLMVNFIDFSSKDQNMQGI